MKLWDLNQYWNEYYDWTDMEKEIRTVFDKERMKAGGRRNMDDSISFRQLSEIFIDTARIPGGYKTDCYIAQYGFIHAGTKILLVGDIATAVNLARIFHCRFDIVEISRHRCDFYEEWIQKENLGGLIQVYCADILEFEVAPETYDLIITGNVLSLIEQYSSVLHKIKDYLKPGGRFVAVPIYKHLKEQERTEFCHKEIEKINNRYDLNHWLAIFKEHGFVMRIQKNFKYKNVLMNQRSSYIDYIMKKAEWLDMDVCSKELYKKRYIDYVDTICDNMRDMMYSLLIYTKELYNEEPELFLGEELNREL